MKSLEEILKQVEKEGDFRFVHTQMVLTAMFEAQTEALKHQGFSKPYKTPDTN